MKLKRFECTYCSVRFTHEQRFMNHKCKQMIRAEEFQTPRGQAAWSFYQRWMREKKHRVQGSGTFLSSRYYMSFMKFVDFAVKVNLPDTATFIKMMVEQDWSPTIWTSDEAYSHYIQFLDRRTTPLRSAKITIEALYVVADQYECDVSEIFDNIQPHELIQLIRQRRISPWLLLHSSKFKQFFVNRTTRDDRVVLETVIRPAYWSEKFTKHPEDVASMKTFIAELSL